MHRAFLNLLCPVLLLLLHGGASAAEFKLADGTTVSGEPVAPNERGVILKAGDRLGTRIEWSKFSPEALKQFQSDPKLKAFVEPLLAPPPVPPENSKAARTAQASAQKRAPAAADFTHPERPSTNASIAAGLASPVGLVAVLLFVAAHFYAGLEIARYRNRPLVFICSVSMIPIIGPIVCLCLPTVPPDSGTAPKADGHSAPTSSAAAVATPETGAHAPHEANLSEEATTPEKPAATVFTRGEITFNRRFFESKFSGFTRLVPGEAERGLEMAFTTARGDFVSRRIGRLDAESLLLVIQQGEAFYEEKIPYIEIREVQVRPAGETTA